MFLNRCTIGVAYEERTILGEHLWAFNRSCAHLEELVFHHLPRKARFGGYGFFHVILTTERRVDELKCYGQIIDYRRSFAGILSLARKKEEARTYALLGLVEKAIERVGKELDIDRAAFKKAISQIRKDGVHLEQLLRPTRYTTDRRAVAFIVWVSGPTLSTVVLRLATKEGAVLHEKVLAENASVLDVAHDFRKSKWSGDSLVVLDRFNRQKFKIDLAKYLPAKKRPARK